LRKVENLPFGGVLTNFAPIEIDANAAAAQFALSRHPEAVDELLAGGCLKEHEPLFRYRGGPEPLNTLPRRTVCFAHLFADLCERVAREQNLVFSEVLDDRWARAAALWKQFDALSV